MQLTTWNINSVRARAHLLPEWLDQRQPDVLCLQEIKCREEEFPRELFESRGYQLALWGQKTYNGVAIAAKAPLTDVERVGLVEGDADSRVIAATVGDLRVINCYVVNGQDRESAKYAHKLIWLDALLARVRAELERWPALVVCGDYNIAPDDRDVHDPELWREKNLCSTPELVDAWRAQHPDDSGRYSHTWWDYQARSFQRGLGMRIDHLLVSAPVFARLDTVEIDREARKLEKTSDHAPVAMRLRP
jgi:exodeoxyribonuclease-3